MFHLDLPSEQDPHLGESSEKSVQGPGICVLYCSSEETVEHLFINCCVWRTVVVHVCDLLNLNVFSPSVSLGEMISNWITNLPRYLYLQSLPLHMMWIFWKVRNRAIFEGEKRIVYSLIQQVISSVRALPL